MHRYDEWNEVKKKTQNNKRKLGLKPRDIFWAKIGQNVGSEEYGKNQRDCLAPPRKGGCARRRIIHRLYNKNTNISRGDW